MDSATKKSNIHVKNHQKICLGAWEHMLRLVPGWPRITLTEHKKMLYESFKYIPRDPPQGNTCVSMAKMRKMSPKACQNDKFFSKFWSFSERSRISWNDVSWCFLMSWSSGNLLGMILDRFGIIHFFMNFLKKFWVQILNEGRSFHPARMNRFGHW